MRTRDVSIVCLTLLLLAGVFWPGLYRYDRLGEGARSIPVRTNRVTGTVQVFATDGWKSFTAKRPANLSTLPADETAKITGTGQFKYGTSFEAELYNGSPWTVYELEYEITAGDWRNPFGPPRPSRCLGAQWTRRFRQTVLLRPFGSGKDYFAVGGSVESCSATWRILSARGVVETR